MKVAQNEPAQFVQRWLSTYRTRSLHAADNTDLWDMTRALGCIAEELLDNLQIFGEVHQKYGDLQHVDCRTWQSLLASGLFSLCEETINASSFFNEPPVRVHSVH